MVGLVQANTGIMWEEGGRARRRRLPSAVLWSLGAEVARKDLLKEGRGVKGEVPRGPAFHDVPNVEMERVGRRCNRDR